MNPMRYCGPGEHPNFDKADTPTPDGVKCLWCGEDVLSFESAFVMDYITESGIIDAYYHEECIIRSTVGSEGHQAKECSCYGGEGCGDDPNISKREAAIRAMFLFEQQNGLERKMIKHKKNFGVYHWDTFDNETFLLDEFDTQEEAVDFVKKKYEGRIGPQGADKVDIVNFQGDIVEQYSVS